MDPTSNVNQNATDPLRPGERRELERLAAKPFIPIAMVGLIFGPLGYALLGKWSLAILCLLTLNWFLLGFFVVPYHIRRIVLGARKELDENPKPEPPVGGVGRGGSRGRHPADD